MTIYDLMLNDLVLYKGHVKKVVGIKRSYNLIDLAINDKDFFTCSVTDCEPIPLTEEILEMNGFEERYMYEDFNVFVFLNFAIYKRKENSSYPAKKFFSSVCCCEFEINYVHELQHALRLCGRNELADNFKVD